MYTEYLGKPQNYSKNLCSLDRDLHFLSQAFSLGKDVASQRFQVIPHAYNFKDVTFGYFFLFQCVDSRDHWEVYSILVLML